MVNTLGSSFNETCSTPEVRENNSARRIHHATIGHFIDSILT